MKQFLTKSVAVVCLASAALTVAYADATKNAATKNEVPKLQILMKNGGEPQIINAAGETNTLTLGTLLDAIGSGLMCNANVKAVPDNADAISFLTLNEKDHNVDVELSAPKTAYGPARKEKLNLGNLIAAAAQTYPGCTAAQMNGKTVDLKLLFKTDKDGNLQAYYLDEQNQPKDFNLGTLLHDTTVRLNKDCSTVKQ